MVDLQQDALVAGELRVGRQHIDQVPGHVARLGLSPEAGQRVCGPVVIDDLDMRIHLHVRLVIRPYLALRVCAAPGYDGQCHWILRLRGTETEQACQPARGDVLQIGLVHTKLLCLTDGCHEQTSDPVVGDAARGRRRASPVLSPRRPETFPPGSGPRG